MSTIRELITTEERVYIFLENRAMRYRFMSDAEREGLDFGGELRPEDDIVALWPDGTVRRLGWAGRLRFRNDSGAPRVDYERYIDGEENYTV